MAYKLHKYEKEFSKNLLEVWPTVYEYSSFLLDEETFAIEHNVNNMQTFLESCTVMTVMRYDRYELYDKIKAEVENLKDTHLFTLARFSVESVYGYSIEKILEIRKTGII